MWYVMNEKLLKYQKLYLLALRYSLAKTGDKVFNSGNEYIQLFNLNIRAK